MRLYIGTIGHTWTLNPNLVLDGNFGMQRLDQSVIGPDYGQNLGLDDRWVASGVLDYAPNWRRW